MASSALTDQQNKRNIGQKSQEKQKSEEHKMRWEEISQAPLPSDDENDDNDCKQARSNGVHVNGNTTEVMKPALLVDFEESIRPCIDLIDRLRGLGVEQDVHLPTIAVVGDQSAGKSSVLEALSGVQLPRGTGIVTRCPLELRMKNRPSGTPWTATISYKEPGNPKMSYSIKRPTDVGDFIRKAQDTLAGNGNGVCKELITLEVESSGIPDLTLIDLPGIARIAMDDQAEDLPEQIRELITSYIKRAETIILAVIPANVDIATTEALQLARRFDPEGNRTLGVITKPDLVDRGSEPELIATITNAKLPLKKGYVCVRCRGQDALKMGMTLEDAIAVEEKFFATTEHFKDYQGHGLLGSRSLARKLTQELVEHIKVSLPELRKNVREGLDNVQNKLKRLGKGVSTNPHQRQIQFVEVMNGFSDEVAKLVESRLVTEGHQMRIHNRFRLAFKAFSTTLDQYSPELTGRKRDEMLGKLEKEIDEWRGKELPRFLNYDMFRTKVGEYIVDYQTPMERTLKIVSGITKEIYDALATKYFHQFPTLQQAVKSKIVALINDAEQSSVKRLEEYLDMERLTYTQDAYFTGKLDKVIAKRVEDENEREKRRQGGQAFVNKLDDVTGPKTRVQAESMYDFILSYMTIAKRRVADTAPMIMCHELLEKLGARVRAEVILMITVQNIADKFRETETIAIERQTNETRYERLRNALAELESYAY